jgi:hypothetical protein
MRLLPLVLALTACSVPDAPGDLDELSAYLFREWDNDDPRVMQEGIRSFEENLDGLDLDGDRDARSFEVSALDEDDVVGLDVPEDVTMSNMVGVAIGAWTPWAPALHAQLATRLDQSPAEPSSEEYARAFVDPTDPACFPTEDCDSIETLNRVLKSNAAYTVWIDMHKDFRWVRVVDDHGFDTGRRAMVARVWTPETFIGEAGNTFIYQTYAVDIWLETDEGSMRLQSNWSENSLSDDAAVIRALVRRSLDDLFEATDQFIEDEIAD